MEMKICVFNRNLMKSGNWIEQPPTDLVKNTPNLFRASMQDALLYGGELTRAALSAMNIRNDRKYVVVDTKVHMLMPGMYPAIPGWHTDGVPRPQKDKPDLSLQETDRPVRYHLLVTGEGCLTEFISDGRVKLNVPVEPSASLYKVISEQVNEKLEKGELSKFQVNSCQVIEWDWWDLHQGIAATKHEWRFLIRVAETDYLQPLKDLREILRTQNTVYVKSAEYGW